MKIRCVAALAAACAILAGCGPGGGTPATDRLPSVTLTLREAEGDQITLAFRFEHMERVKWSGKVLRAQIVKLGEKPVSGTGPALRDPPGEIYAGIAVLKTPGSDRVIFVPMWGASDGEAEPIDLAAPDGDVNVVSIPAYKEHRVNQVLQTSGGPDRPVPFDPDKGIDLITVGYAWAIHVWADGGR